MDEVIEFPRLSDLPPETPVRLTRIGEHGGEYADFGTGMYCSPEGKKSTRRARVDLWAVRHQTREDRPGPVWFYCIDHLPHREWRSQDGRVISRVREIACSSCFLTVPAGSICAETGDPHE